MNLSDSTNPHPLQKFKQELYELQAYMEQDLLNIEDKEKQFEAENNLSSEKITACVPKVITIVVNGQPFKTSSNNILKQRDSLFFFCLISLGLETLKNNNWTLIFQRSPKHFEHILNYLKHKFSDLSSLSKEDVQELLEEAQYYELQGFIRQIEKYLPVVIIDYRSPGPYQVNNYSSDYNLIGELDVSAIREQDNRGITTTTPGWLVFEFNKVAKFNAVSVIGYKGNTSFSSSNGSNAVISVSMDGEHFEKAGRLGTIGNSLCRVYLEITVEAKFIKFEGQSYIGFSYVEIHNIK